MKKTSPNEPLNDFLKRNIRRKPVSFHMPGHKYGRFPYAGKSGKFSEFDITEITGADNIKDPRGVIRESLDVISEIYGSDRTFYMTNGSTGGILSMMKYISAVGGKVLVSRDCHMSVINGAVLFNVPFEFIKTETEDGIPLPVKTEDVEEALARNSGVSAVLLTSPNYYGLAADLAGIRKLTDERNVILAVDEAHGSHLKFTEAACLGALDNNADIVCHSMHKTMPVYNQGALLHIKGNRINFPVIKDILGKLGTSSPSYPILASMEKAAVYYNTEGEKLYRDLKEKINTLQSDCPGSISFVRNDDFTRLVIDVSGKGLSGFEASAILGMKGIDMEACDSRHIIAICTPSNNKRDFRKLSRALEKIEGKVKYETSEPSCGIPEKAMEIHEAADKKTRLASLDEADGGICGTIIIPYPPGVPCLYPGEVISAEMLIFLREVIDGGGTVLGLESGMIPVLEQI